VLVMGPDEFAEGEATLRDMIAKGESRVAIADAVEEIGRALGA